MKPAGKTYRVGDALGSVLEIYLLDGLAGDCLAVFEEDAPAFARIHEFVKTAWAARKSLFVPNDDDFLADLLNVLNWAGDSLEDDIRAEERLPPPPRPKRGRDELEQEERPLWDAGPGPTTRDVEVLQVCKKQRSALDDFTARLIRQRVDILHAAEASK